MESSNYRSPKSVKEVVNERSQLSKDSTSDDPGQRNTLTKGLHQTRVTFKSSSYTAHHDDSGFSEICQDDEASTARRRSHLDEIPSETMFKNIPTTCFSTPCKSIVIGTRSVLKEDAEASKTTVSEKRPCLTITLGESPLNMPSTLDIKPRICINGTTTFTPSVNLRYTDDKGNAKIEIGSVDECLTSWRSTSSIGTLYTPVRSKDSQTSLSDFAMNNVCGDLNADLPSYTSESRIQIKQEPCDFLDTTNVKYGHCNTFGDTQIKTEPCDVFDNAQFKYGRCDNFGSTNIKPEPRDVFDNSSEASCVFKRYCDTQLTHDPIKIFGNTSVPAFELKDNGYDNSLLSELPNVAHKAVYCLAVPLERHYNVDLNASIQETPSIGCQESFRPIEKKDLKINSHISLLQMPYNACPVKANTPSSVLYSDISDDDTNPSPADTVNDINNNAEIPFKHSTISSADTGTTSDVSSDEVVKHKETKAKGKTVRRKAMTPRKSAAKRDPRFKGVTVWLQTEFRNGHSQLQISAFYSNVKVSTPSPKIEETRVPHPNRRTSPDVYSCSETEGNSLPRHAREPYLIAKTCASCRTRRTPLWRDAEDGTPLCNACGIRYKKYRLRCSRCWHIPKKDIKTYPNCPSCGASLRFSFHRKSW